MDIKPILDFIPINPKTISEDVTTSLSVILITSIANKVYNFFKNLTKKPNSKDEIELFTEALHYVQISPENLSKVYSNILNNYSSNDNKDLYSKYFKILSNLTLSEIRLLERIYNGDDHKIWFLKSELNIQKDLSIETLKFNHLVHLGATLDEIWDGIGENPIHKNEFLLRMTEVGIDFYEICNNLKEK